MQETNSPKGAFLGLMSHEIRLALNKISGINNLMLETALTAEQMGYIQTIQGSSETVLALMNDLIDFSLIEAGEFRLDEIEFDLRTAIDEAMESVALRAVEKGIEVHTMIHTSVPEMVQGDPARVRQIIVTLAGNAVQLSESGEIVLTVKTVSEEPDHAVVRFNISEFGFGGDVDQIQQLFKPFSQQDFISSWKYGRTGLDLALSKRFAQLMGGNIGLSSIEGKGATFWFSVELIKRPQSAQTSIAPVQSLEGMKILIVDPSASGRRILTHYLESAGCSCNDFERGEDALSEMTDAKKPGKKYDAMIVAMQQVGGAEYDSFVRIRGHEAVRTIPLVLLTAVGKRGDAQKLKEVRGAAYLTRPLKQHQLIECMRMLRTNTDALAAGTEPLSKSRPLITRHSIREESSGKKIRILVAEDNASNRKTIKRYLDQAGYTCDIAENGADALNSFGNREYDLVFMDCHMPIMSGYDASKAIRKAESQHPGKHIPICAMIAESGEKEMCREAGMDDIMVKPLNRADFIGMIEKWERKVISSKNSTLPQSKNDPVGRYDAIYPSIKAHGA
jgi:two-component system, sensor histidine kinase and response regulator